MHDRKAYQELLQTELNRWDADIGKLRAEADKAEADARIKYYERINEIESQQSELRSMLEKLKSASDDAWKDLKAGAEKTRKALGEALKSASSRFQ